MVRRSFLKILAGLGLLTSEVQAQKGIEEGGRRWPFRKYYIEVDEHSFFYRGAGLPIQLRLAAKCIYCTTTGKWIKGEPKDLLPSAFAPEVDREWLVNKGYAL